MVVLQSLIFRKYPEIVFGFSTKISSGAISPYFFNMSLSVGDDPKRVKDSRREFFQALNLSEKSVALQKQTHSDICTYTQKAGMCGESDALLTDKKNLGLAVSVADCTPVFLYDTKNKVIAAVHSGWRGTQKKILANVLEKMANDFNSRPEDLIAYIGPSISQENYEVGEEFTGLFDEKYLKAQGEKYLLDVKGVNLDILLEAGVPESHIQVSDLCTFQMDNLLHSYRRNGLNSGRLLGIIAMKGNNEH
ncbi:MAG: peptidoglycan editing factor PgeF [Ignavibacteria bacterium]|nr:peptidoglycan editing factor PgeF [Ignavibacteria bacterium]MCU7502452.1 peptidoglycan editing factor PgeF [Ignavibacteria bacterium]MCU7514983.1 peptidoglycan editing factor PgeF [Ignavibacteria bacterium]